MVGTISPLVQGSRRQWLSSVTILVGAATLSAGAVAALFSLALHPFVSTLSGGDIAAVLAIAAVAVAALEFVLPPRLLPCVRGSVPQRWWIQFGPNLGALFYGAVLGTGLTTVIPFASFYWVALSVGLLGPPYGWVIGSAYGLGRTLSVPIASTFVAFGARPQVVCGAIVRLSGSAKAACGVASLLAAIGIFVFSRV
jgi:hypothetical protein